MTELLSSGKSLDLDDPEDDPDRMQKNDNFANYNLLISKRISLGDPK